MKEIVKSTPNIVGIVKISIQQIALSYGNDDYAGFNFTELRSN